MSSLASDLDFLEEGAALSEEEVVAPTPVRLVRLRRAGPSAARHRRGWLPALLVTAGVAAFAAAVGFAVVVVLGLLILG